MTHSLLNADRRTHVKIVIVALVGAIMVVATGIAAHVRSNGDLARLEGIGPALKAGKPITYTGRATPDFR